jgi:hypothetical protein
MRKIEDKECILSSSLDQLLYPTDCKHCKCNPCALSTPCCKSPICIECTIANIAAKLDKLIATEDMKILQTFCCPFCGAKSSVDAPLVTARTSLGDIEVLNISSLASI